MILRLLGRSATGQEMSVYTTFSRGPRRAGDPDGPEEYHVVLLDNGRSNMVGTEIQEMLRCIRCGACMNHCPVYQAVGGHAYGWVYPGPMGAVLTPALIGVEAGRAAAERLDLLRALRGGLPDADPAAEADAALARAGVREAADAGRGADGLGVWACLAARPWLYRLATRVGERRRCGLLAAGAGGSARCRSPAAGPATRDLPAPAGADLHGPVEGRAAVSARERILGRLRAGRGPAGGGAAGGGRGAARGASGRAGAGAGAEPRAAGGWCSSWPRPRRRRRRSSRVSAIGELPRALAHELASATCRRRCASGASPTFDGARLGRRSRPAGGRGGSRSRRR